ncbi:MAG: 23S rRNA (guanosine(2251)-2'-O)-methyltransferase RlmB [Proteobacteria bacterium]|nr:MAG: 23S rRNA (guanosine(2251)-2'-O)-methyltransferase RlmB [Pseudomonadota bacterium]PIE18459.1 MAG: 23S rRNA (guanosine(2251)-2'-O)-methyltransferase RlmB [Pseudomonadota bacterium]
MSRLVYGLHPLRERLRRGRSEISALWVDEGRARRDAELEALLAKLPAEVTPQRVPREQLELICGSSSHQGVVAAVGDYPYVDLEGLLEGDAVEATPALLLVVDGVTDPQNLGAMLRSALVFGASGVVLTRDRCASITPTVVRVSSGASEHLRCARVTNLSRALEKLKELGVWIVGTVERGGEHPARIDLRVPCALVLGSEGKGMRPNVKKHCDLLLTLPAAGPIGALNVAAATTAAFYEAARQRSSR